MDLYYYSSVEEQPEGPDEWSYWNIVVSLNGKQPKKGDPIIVFNHETGISLRTNATIQDEIEPWPFEFTAEMKLATIRTIFESED